MLFRQLIVKSITNLLPSKQQIIGYVASIVLPSKKQITEYVVGKLPSKQQIIEYVTDTMDTISKGAFPLPSWYCDDHKCENRKAHIGLVFLLFFELAVVVPFMSGMADFYGWLFLFVCTLILGFVDINLHPYKQNETKTDHKSQDDNHARAKPVPPESHGDSSPRAQSGHADLPQVTSQNSSDLGTVKSDSKEGDNKSDGL